MERLSDDRYQEHDDCYMYRQHCRSPSVEKSFHLFTKARVDVGRKEMEFEREAMVLTE